MNRKENPQIIKKFMDQNRYSKATVTFLVNEASVALRNNKISFKDLDRFSTSVICSLAQGFALLNCCTYSCQYLLGSQQLPGISSKAVMCLCVKTLRKYKHTTCQGHFYRTIIYFFVLTAIYERLRNFWANFHDII